MAKLTKKQMMYAERARKAAETRRRNRAKQVFKHQELGAEVPISVHGTDQYNNSVFETPYPDNKKSETSSCYTKPTISKLIEDNRLGLDSTNRYLNGEFASLWQYIYKLEERINQIETRLG